MSNNLPTGCHVIDDGGPSYAVVEAGDDDLDVHPLWVHVGPVFADGKEQDEPGVWIKYQESYLAGPLSGPVLLTPQVWNQLAKLVAEKLSTAYRVR